MSTNPVIQKLKTSTLVPYERNAKKHPSDQVASIANQIKNHGWDVPIVVDENLIILKGHGRALAAKMLGLEEVPCIIRSGLTPDEKRAIRIADNKVAESEWDFDFLKIDMLDLKGKGFDLALTGFSDFSFMKEPKKRHSDPDEGQTVPTESFVRLGDIWQMDNHRLLCGDSTDAESIKRLRNGVTPILMVTDPPYGVKYDSSWRNDALGTDQDPTKRASIQNDDRADWTESYALSGAQIAYVWHASSFLDVFMQSLRAAGFEIKQQIIWRKINFVMGRQSYHFRHEPCWYAVKKGKDHHWLGDRKQTTIWEAASPLSSMSTETEEASPHPTQKPVVIYEIPIQNHTVPGDYLYDPFSGSGTAFIACEKTDRRCLGVELDPCFAMVILNRWAKFTGGTPYLLLDDGTKKSISEVKAERENAGSVGLSSGPGT